MKPVHSLIPRRPALLLTLVYSLLFWCQTESGAAERESDGGWKLSSEHGGVAIYSRDRAGSSIKEFKGVGEIPAAARAVQNVLDDRDAYPRFMPYVVECKTLQHDENSLIAYQHLAPPLVSERDYTIRVRHNQESAPGGTIFHTHWEPANALGPAERPGIIRVKINEGSWLLEPLGDRSTRATYCIYTDSGGTLPGFIANRANQIAIGRLFEVIRKQVLDPKYSVAR